MSDIAEKLLSERGSGDRTVPLNLSHHMLVRGEGNVAVTSVSPLISRVDSTDLAGRTGVPFDTAPGASLPKLHVLG